MSVEVNRREARRLSVCVLEFFVPPIKAAQKILCSLLASPVSPTCQCTVNLGQSHNHSLQSKIIVGEAVLLMALETFEDVST